MHTYIKRLYNKSRAVLIRLSERCPLSLIDIEFCPLMHIYTAAQQARARNYWMNPFISLIVEGHEVREREGKTHTYISESRISERNRWCVYVCNCHQQQQQWKVGEMHSTSPRSALSVNRYIGVCVCILFYGIVLTNTHTRSQSGRGHCTLSLSLSLALLSSCGRARDPALREGTSFIY